MPQYSEVVYATNIDRDYEHKEAYQMMNSKLQGKYWVSHCFHLAWVQSHGLCGLLVLLDKILYMTFIFSLSVHFHKEEL